MNKLVIIISACLLVVNVLAGLIISAYEPFNVCFSSGAIVVTAILLCLLNMVQLKDAFRISLAFLFTFCGLVEFILGCSCYPSFTDNGSLIAALLMVVGEVAILLICSLTSKSIK